MKRFWNRFDPAVLPILLALGILVGLCLLALSPAHAIDTKKSWGLALPINSGVSDPGMNYTLSGVSIAESAASPFEVDGVSGTTMIDLGNYDHDFFTVVPGTIPFLSGVTPDQDNDDTFTIEYASWSVNDAAHYNAAEWTPIVNQKTFGSATSPFPASFICTDDYLGIRFKSSATAFQEVPVTLLARHSREGDQETLVVLGSDFVGYDSSSGTTTLKTAAACPDGTKWVALVATGSDCHLERYGGTATTADPVLEENKELVITREEYELYVLRGSTGSSSGDGLNTQYFNRRPY